MSFHWIASSSEGTLLSAAAAATEAKARVADLEERVLARTERMPELPSDADLVEDKFGQHLEGTRAAILERVLAWAR